MGWQAAQGVWWRPTDGGGKGALGRIDRVTTSSALTGLPVVDPVVSEQLAKKRGALLTAKLGHTASKINAYTASKINVLVGLGIEPRASRCGLEILTVKLSN